MTLDGRLPRLARASLLLAAGLVFLFGLGAAVHLPLVGPLADGSYYGALALATAACLARGLRGPAPRRPWLVLAMGMVLWIAGDLVYTYALGTDPPTPSIADPLYLALFPAAYLALVELVRDRLEQTSGALLLDGLVAALAVGALAVATVLGTVAHALGGDTLANAINLAYPIADTLLVGLVVVLLALTGWRPGRDLVLLCASFGVLAVADGVFAYTNATGRYQVGLQDVGWPIGMVLLGWAAWQPPRSRHLPPADGVRVVAVPIALGAAALGVLVLGHARPVSGLAVGLAAGALLAMMARLAITFAERARLLASTREEALTDAMTGLRNRRSLARDLDVVVNERRRYLLLLFDLNGFKLYNDAFGHPAGDALLGRLARELDRACAPGAAYRMGGDEFCALLPLIGAPSERDLVARTSAALSADGEAFSVRASWGSVRLPEKGSTARDVLGLADRRMYAQKHSGRPSVRRQSTDVLLRVLEERHPDLGHHLRAVSALAEVVAERVGLDADEREQVVLAAELHDVGKVAIPDEILGKPSPLEPDDWELIRRHTLVGERIVVAAPALAGVARLVRSSHERWDGGGYPDGLAREAIPLGARIVAVCDAWEAMTCGRPYRAARTHAQAREELRRHAGTQFDPHIVAAFLDAEREPVVPSGRLREVVSAN